MAGCRGHIYGHIAAHGWGDLRDLNRTWCQTDPTRGRWDVGGCSLIAPRTQKGQKTIPVPDTLQMGNAMCGRAIPYDSHSKFIFLITGTSFLSELWNCVSLLAATTSCVFNNSSQILLRYTNTDTDGKTPTLSRKYTSISDNTFEKLPPLIDWLFWV